MTRIYSSTVIKVHDVNGSTIVLKYRDFSSKHISEMNEGSN